MDVGKKCLIMSVLGAVLAIASSPFVIYMVFSGRPFEAIVEKKTLEPYSSTVLEPVLKTIDETTGLPYNVAEFTLSPGEYKQQYKAVLNVETNGTLHICIYSKQNSTFRILHAFNVGNYTIGLEIPRAGVYGLNVTSVGSEKVRAKFKLKESWYYEMLKPTVELDLLKTAVPPVLFVIGIAILSIALVKMRRAAKEAKPIAEEKAVRQRYIEVEEEEY
jgi:hypothetical protein